MKLAAAFISALFLGGCASEEFVFRPSETAQRAQAEAKVLVPEILSGVSDLEIISIDPGSYRRAEEQTDARLLGYKIIGSAPIRNSAVQQRLSAAFIKGVTESNGLSFMCFSPRHALRIRKEGRSIVFLICFECMKVKAIGDSRLEWFFTTGDEEVVFDAVLGELGIPKAG